MGYKGNNVFIRDGLAVHTAFLAWKRISPTSAPPASIEVLKRESRKSAVYRLRGVAKAGGHVVVKRKDIGKLTHEARFYAEVFPKLTIPMAICYGYLEEFEGNSWLFLEDAGEIWYSPEQPAHCSLAIRWMSCLHSTPAKVVMNLWNSGPAYFRSVLREARQGVRSSLAHPSIRDSWIGTFESILDHLDVIENGWAHIEQACSGVPHTLVHGDFKPKNVRVRGIGSNSHLLVIDWETAGAAPPATDIAMLPGGRPGRQAYFEMLRETFPGLVWEDIERLHRIGEIFRLLHCVQWASPSFEHEWVERAKYKMLHYQRALHGLLQDTLWLHS